MICIHKRNRCGGFVSTHKAFCAYCEEDATQHAYLKFWCGNVCDVHADRLSKTRKDVQIDNEIVLPEAA